MAYRSVGKALLVTNYLGYLSIVPIKKNVGPLVRRNVPRYIPALTRCGRGDLLIFIRR